MHLPEETPVALSFQGTTLAVMMATPRDLEALALGFALSEGLIRSRGDVADITCLKHPQGHEVQLILQGNAAPNWAARQRRIAGPVGCGLCGIERLEDALPTLPTVVPKQPLGGDEIENALAALNAGQILRQKFGAMHGAGAFLLDSGMARVAEDVGRHNAVDKLIGGLMQADKRPSDYALAVSCRVSVEIIQKAAMAGIARIVAASLPTKLAVAQAQKAGIALIARGRDGQMMTYTGMLERADHAE